MCLLSLEASEVIGFGSYAGLLVKLFNFTHYSARLVASGQFRLPFQCKRYELSQIYVKLEYVVHNLKSAIVHTEPESHEDIELEGSVPPVFPLQLVDLSDGLFLVTKENLFKRRRLNVVHLDHVFDHNFLIHVNINWHLNQIFLALWNLMHLLIADLLEIDLSLLWFLSQKLGSVHLGRIQPPCFA